MGYQGATLERTRSKQYDGGPQLPPNLLQPKRVQVAKKSYSSLQSSASESSGDFQGRTQGNAYGSSSSVSFAAQKAVDGVRKTRSRRRGRPVSELEPLAPRGSNALCFVNYRLFAVVGAAMVVGLLLVKSLSLPIFTASAPQGTESLPQKIVPLPSPVQVNSPASPAVVALRQAIIGKESETNFLALNPHSKALGLAQIMPDNLSVWSQELLGRRLTPDEFLKHPELQLMIIDYKLSEYWQKALASSNGDEELAVLKVASNWYSGKSNRYKSTTAQWFEGTDGRSHRYPSIAEYSHSVLRKYKRYREES